jgi:hypothetical protein
VEVRSFIQRIPPDVYKQYSETLPWATLACIANVVDDGKGALWNDVEGSSSAVVPKVCSADDKGSATSSQGIRGYISLMTTVKFAYAFN